MVKNEIKVFARLKPEAKMKNVVNYQIHRRPKKHVEEDYLVLNNGVQKSITDYINNRPESWNFSFYKIFDDHISQDEVFENVVQPVVQSVLNGYNATIFAYGQTGSGKTYTITGDPERYEDRGVLPRTVQYLFETIQKNPDNLYSVEIAYLEIYNENGYDLLDPKHEVVTKLEDLPRVTIQEDETGTLRLKNLSFRNVTNEKDALALLFLGDTNRAISETPMNPQSSRSHCIFTIAVSVKQSGTRHLTKAKMHLVDLAGSERVYKCCISGTILTEAKHINLSLHYLEQVIVCLGQQNVSHIPYRNSLLTAILRDSLGGNCLTTMLATLSLNTSNLEETISTCRFSQRVALIKNDVNLVLERNPEDENRFLKMEVERLKNQIAQMTERSIISGDLTPNEKQDLNFQVCKFLESDAKFDWENDDRKVKYFLQVLRENLKNRKGENKCVEKSEKDLNYYRNLVAQRDKEISALINMLKKTGRNSSSNLAVDPGAFNAHENDDGTSPRISVIAKKVRLRDLMVEARSIAELIKNGKASIGDLRTLMMTDITDPVEIQELHKNLQIEQSRLAHNLSLLKILKSEANDLKTALTKSEYTKKFVTTLTHRNVVTQKLSAPGIETVSNKSSIDETDDRQRYVISSQTIKSQNSRNRDDEQFGKTVQHMEPLKILSMIPKEMKIISARRDQGTDNCEVVCTSSVKDSGDSLEDPGPVNKITDLEVERNTSGSPESKTTKFVIMNSKKTYHDSDSRRSLVGERFLDTKTLPNGESRRSSFRAPAFFQDMLRSDADSGDGFESLISERNVDLNLCGIETKTSKEMGQSFREDLSISDDSSYLADVPKNMINSDKSKVSNVSRVEKFSNYKDSDCEVDKRDRSSSEHKLSRDRYDEFYKISNSSEKYVKENSEESDIQEHQPIFIPDENRESNTIEENSIIIEDDSFIKSLPLTGDPEIDEEIIAFYRAKRSGGTY